MTTKRLPAEGTKPAWRAVCPRSELLPDVGTCVELDSEQVAVFWLTVPDTLHAVSNYDPFGQANVISRGIVGSLGGAPVVASPLYKQHFNLDTGVCIEDPGKSLAVFDVRVVDDQVELRRRPA
jgi:nitrite reductase (NADH) small subunit